MASERAGYVRRFSVTERAIHWIHASAFFVLLGTGLVLYLPSLSEAVSRRPLVKAIHIDTAIAWAVALALVVALGDRKGLRRTLRDLDLFDEDDRLWLRRIPRPQGRFNAGQKLNAALTASFAVLFAVSGFFLWLGERDHSYQWASTILLHDGLMYVSVVLARRPPLPRPDLPRDAALAPRDDGGLGAARLGLAPPPQVGRGRRGRVTAAAGLTDSCTPLAIPSRRLSHPVSARRRTPEGT